MFEKALYPLLILMFAVFFSACSDDDDDHDPATLTEIQITANIYELPVGLVSQLSAVGYYSDGVTSDLTSSVVWTSLKPEIASVTQGQGEAKGESFGNVVIEAVFKEIKGSVNLKVTDAVIQKITVSPEASSVPLGVDIKYSAMGYYSDGNNHDISLQPELTWVSSDETVATVTVNETAAVAETLSDGTTDISARIENVVSTEQRLEVRNVEMTAIWITPEAWTMPLGVTRQFTATATFTDGTTDEIAGNNQTVWTTSRPDYVQDKGNGAFHGVDLGTSIIRVKYGALHGANDVSVTVEEAALSHMIVRAGEKGDDRDDIPLGVEQQFSASAVFTDGREYDITGYRQVHWQSSDTTRATVTLAGLVKTLKEGSVTITASAAHFTEEAIKTITVTEPEVYRVKAVPVDNNFNLSAGNSQQYQAMGWFTDGTFEDIAGQFNIIWEQSSEAASITQSGLLAFDGALQSPDVSVVKFTLDQYPTGFDTTRLSLAAAELLNVPLLGVDFIGALTRTGATDAELQFSDSVEVGGVDYAVMTHSQAQQFCEDLIYNGFDDWRLATESELIDLFNLYDGDSAGESILATEHYWVVGMYWSAAEGDPSTHKAVDLSSGISTSEDETGTLHASCVRDS